MMYHRIICILMVIAMSGCGSTNNPKFDAESTSYNPNLPDIELQFDVSKASAKKILDFQTSDYLTVVKPYLDALNKIDSYTVEEICAPESLQFYDEIITLNPSSIHIKKLKLECVKNQLSDADYYQELSDITDIAAVLLKSGSGETLNSVIEIRELSEIYTIFELAGLTILDTEIEFHDNILYYKLHCLDSQTNQFFYRYVSNINFFTAVFARLSPQGITKQQTSKIMYGSLKLAGYSTAIAYQFWEMALDDKHEDIINLQDNVQTTAVGQIRLAQAALMLERDDILELYVDNILSFAEQGLTEANSFIAHFLFVKDPRQSWPEIQAELEKIDKLMGAGEGMRLFLESLSFRSDFEAQLEVLITISSADILKEIQHYSDYLQSRNGTYSLDLSPKIHSLMRVQANHGVPQAKLFLARHLFQQPKASPEDLSRGRTLLESAVADGYDEAQLSLGIKYGKGSDGYPVNKEKALELYRLAAAQNNPYALHNVASYYRYGYAVKKDLSTAIEYYEKSITSGFSDGHCIVGEVYRTELMPADFERAEEHYRKGISKLDNSDHLVTCYEGLGMIQKFIHKDLEAAKNMFHIATTLNSGFAAFEIAVLYDFDGYKMQDLSKAREYYEKAIELGNHAAGGNLGYMYEAGKGSIQVDTAKALEYYLLGAQVKHPQSMNNLATFYLQGIEVEQDIDKAISLYKAAADHGNKFAAENYGDLLWEGKHLPGNYIKACDYYQVAYEQQYKDAYSDIAFCYSYGAGRYKNLDKALQILEEGISLGYDLYYRAALIYQEKGQVQKAETYLLQALDAGVLNAYAELGSLYLEQERFGDALKIYQMGIKDGEEFTPDIAQMQWLGQGMKQDKEKAIASFRIQARKGAFDTNHYIADRFFFDFQGQPKYEEAFKYYSKIENPNGVILNIIGEMYRFGWHVKQDLAKAADYYQQSAEQGHEHALFNLGEMHREGDYFNEDMEKAASYFLQAADIGLKTAMIQLARLYMNGGAYEPVEKDAEFWLKKADWENDENAVLLAELLLSKSGSKAKEEGLYWLTLALQSQAEGVDTLMQKFGITKDELQND